MPKQFTFGEGSSNCRTIDYDKRGLTSFIIHAMDTFGKQLFAGTRFTVNNDRRIRDFSCPACLPHYPGKGFTAAHQTISIRIGRFPAETKVSVIQVCLVITFVQASVKSRFRSIDNGSDFVKNYTATLLKSQLNICYDYNLGTGEMISKVRNEIHQRVKFLL